MYVLDKPTLGPLRSCFDQLDQDFLKNLSYPASPSIFISSGMLFREETMFNMYVHHKLILGP